MGNRKQSNKWLKYAGKLALSQVFQSLISFILEYLLM